MYNFHYIYRPTICRNVSFDVGLIFPSFRRHRLANTVARFWGNPCNLFWIYIQHCRFAYRAVHYRYKCVVHSCRAVDGLACSVVTSSCRSLVVPTEVAIVKMSGQTWLCSTCTTRTAVTFCTCGTTETFLCEQCCASHFSKLSTRVHMNLAIACYGSHKKPGFMERLQARATELPGRAEFLRQNLLKTNECLSLFSEKVEDIRKIR